MFNEFENQDKKELEKEKAPNVAIEAVKKVTTKIKDSIILAKDKLSQIGKKDINVN
jgi:hypothetical protein